MSESPEDTIDGWPLSRLHFRVHDEGSVARYTDSEGFTAAGPSFRSESMSNREWMDQHHHLHWKDLSGFRSDMVKHVNGGWADDCLWDDGSDWISVTSSFDWAVWETARRLPLGRYEPVSIAVIVDRKNVSEAYRGCRHVIADSYSEIRAYKSEDLDDYDKGERRKAASFTKSSSETLYYGSIFEKDIIRNQVCDERLSDQRLPLRSGAARFFIPRKYWAGRNWTDTLVWVSGQDSFYSARDKIRRRRAQIAGSRM